MAWNGYFQYGGQELINVARTEAYAGGQPWFRPLFKNTSLPILLGESYTTPVGDAAPWYDANIPESADFFGLYPLDVTGIENSTRTSTVVESTRDGGASGRVRHATKAVVFNAALLASSDCGAEYGMRWLNQLLLGAQCSPTAVRSCVGDDLCYLNCEPDLSLTETLVFDGGGPTFTGDDFDGGTPLVTGPTMDAGGPEDIAEPLDALDEFTRTLRQTIFNNGPTVTAKRRISSCGGSVWTVSFTGVAGNPFQYSQETPIIVGFLDPEVSDPYVIPEGGTIDLDGAIFDDSACAVPVYSPVFDPLCPALVPPPGPPPVPLGCFTPPETWDRRQFTVPRQYIPLWGEAVPKFEIKAVDGDLRNLRIRFYSDVFGDGSILDDPCAYCGDIVVSYIPEGYTMVFDASDQVIYVETGSQQQRRRADHLVFKTDGTPFEWPALTCGFDYVVTLDLPEGETILPIIDFSLYTRVA